MGNIKENKKNMNNSDQIYLNQKKSLFNLYKNNLPQSIILSGNELEILSNIAFAFSELIVNKNTNYTFEDFLNFSSDGNQKNSPFIYLITKI